MVMSVAGATVPNVIMVPTENSLEAITRHTAAVLLADATIAGVPAATTVP